MVGLSFLVVAGSLYSHVQGHSAGQRSYYAIPDAIDPRNHYLLDSNVNSSTTTQQPSSNRTQLLVRLATPIPTSSTGALLCAPGHPVRNFGYEVGGKPPRFPYADGPLWAHPKQLWQSTCFVSPLCSINPLTLPQPYSVSMVPAADPRTSADSGQITAAKDVNHLVKPRPRAAQIAKEEVNRAACVYAAALWGGVERQRTTAPLQDLSLVKQNSEVVRSSNHSSVILSRYRQRRDQ